MPSKSASKSASLLSAVAVIACGASAASTAFATLGAPAVAAPVRSGGLGARPSGEGHAAGLAGGCALGAAVAFLGASGTAKRRGGRAAAVGRAGKSLTDRLTGTGPDSIQAGKDTCSFATLVAALQAAGLVEALTGPGPFTVFAPDDKSFDAFLSGANLTAAQLLANPDLAKILKHHVISGLVLQKDFKNTTLTTLAGTEVTVKKGVKGVSIGGVLIKKVDITADNGVIHIMSGVIMP